MSRKKKIGLMLGLGAASLVAALGGAAFMHSEGPLKRKAASTALAVNTAPAIAVTAVRAHQADFVATLTVTGSLVPREEILVGPEVEGLRVIEVLADEGDRVTKGQVLARLVSDTLDAQLAQNEAAIQRSTAAIAQAKSNILAAEARLTEARNALNRGKPLAKSGYLSESGMDQREAAAKTAEAQLAQAQDGLKVAEAEKAQLEAQRREITWRLQRTNIMAPADGIVSRRIARVGSYATGASDAMFRIIAKGEIELDAEIPEVHLRRLKVGQQAKVTLASDHSVSGVVRLVSPEVDRSTRLGRVRIKLGDDSALRIGSFARGAIEVGRSRGLAVPVAAVLYGPEGPSVQLVTGGAIKTRRVKLGLTDNGLIEVREGLTEGDVVVAKSGTFLRDGDAVRAVLSDSEPQVKKQTGERGSVAANN